jgi:hypothetical protein
MNTKRLAINTAAILTGAVLGAAILWHAHADGDAGSSTAPYFEVTEGSFGPTRFEFETDFLQRYDVEQATLDQPLQPYDEVIVPAGEGFIQSEDGYRIWIRVPSQPPE